MMRYCVVCCGTTMRVGDNKLLSQRWRLSLQQHSLFFNFCFTVGINAFMRIYSCRLQNVHFSICYYIIPDSYFELSMFYSKIVAKKSYVWLCKEHRPGSNLESCGTCTCFLCSYSPPTLWAQRRDKIYLTIDIEDVKNEQIKQDDNSLHFR